MFYNKKLALGSACLTSRQLRHRILGPLGSSSFSDGHSAGMETTRILFALKQGPRSLEQHVREFLVFANYSDLPDITLIEIFCDGINQPQRSEFRREGTRASLAQFLDYALLTVGSTFTVGVAEERDTAPNCVNTATLEHAHKMAATTTPRSVISASHKPSQVPADVKEPSQVPADVKEPSQVPADVKDSSQATAYVKKSSRVPADVKEPSRVPADVKEPSQVPADVKEPSQVPADVNLLTCTPHIGNHS